MSFKDFFFSGPGRAFVIIALVVCAASFYVGRGMGYDTGRAVAAMSANSAAEAKYQEGYDAGKEKGLAEGKLDGIKQGREEMTKIYETKLEAEYEKGRSKGREEGRQEIIDMMSGIEAEDQYLASEAPASSSSGSSSGSSSDSSPTNDIDPNTYQVYYTTHAGQKYHRRECGHLIGHDWNNMSLSQAWARDYDPCADCKPPSKEDVYGS